jgi:hypothetical protein
MLLIKTLSTYFSTSVNSLTRYKLSNYLIAFPYVNCITPCQTIIYKIGIV